MTGPETPMRLNYHDLDFDVLSQVGNAGTSLGPRT